MFYLYDGSFEGMLTALAEALQSGEAEAQVLSEASPQPTLWEDVFRVGTRTETAEKLLRQVRVRVSAEAARRLLHAWCSEVPGIANPLLHYLRLAFERGADVDLYHTHPAVREVRIVTRRVTGEIHRLNGLLRFRRLADGSFYAPVAPDANVILAVAGHFRHRLADERWLIQDVKRGLGVFWDRRRLEMAELAAAPAVTETCVADALSPAVLHSEEARCQRLWQEYFDAVAIPERINPNLQRRCMPRRYWAYLIEKPQQRTRPASDSGVVPAVPPPFGFPKTVPSALGVPEGGRSHGQREPSAQ